MGGTKRVNEAMVEETLKSALRQMQERNLPAAEALCRGALAEAGDHAGAWHLLGLILSAEARYGEAVDAHRKAAELAPSAPNILACFGMALHRLGKLEEAISVYQRALALEPARQQIQNNLGSALMGLGRMEEAVAAYWRAVELQPGDASARRNLGRALRQMNRLDEAIVHSRAALALEPNRAEDWNTLGSAFHAQQKFDEAAAAYGQALRLEPGRVDALNNLADILKDTGQVPEAIACYRRIVAANPNAADLLSNLLYTLHFDPTYDSHALLREHRSWDARFAKPLPQPHGNDRSPRRRLKIGYVSPDLRAHVVGWNLLPLLSRHDHARFEIFGYAGVAAPDGITRQLQGHCDGWRNIYGMDDQKAAEVIRDDGIDILVDLSLHMAHNRLLVFAARPAPVQVSYLGYCSTTGLSAMDYRLSDPHLDPAGSDLSCYSEETVRLPVSYWCYQPGGSAPPIQPAPCVKNGYITFGCLNNFSKVSADAMRAWGRILEAAPRSRLLLHCPEGSHRQAAERRLEENGISPQRVEWMGFQSWTKYMQSYDRIDVVLDPFPYGGGITSCDALWMGVPVVSLSGRTAVGRGGRSILSNLGLGELVADTVEDYVRLAASGEKWIEHRAGLRQRMIESPLMDSVRFARDVEEAFGSMWRKWASGS